MTLAPLAILASAFLHALWNALLKREAEPRTAVAGVLGFAVCFAGAAALATGAPAFATRAGIGWAVGAGVFEGVYFVTLAAALARAAYGVVYAIARGGAMLVVWPASRFLLGEPATARGAGGAAVVAGGLALVATSGGARASRSGLLFAAACAASIAGYHLCYDRALVHGARPAPLFAVALGVALPFVLAASLRHLRAAPPAAASASAPQARRRVALRWAVDGVITTASFLLFLWGLAATGAAVALTLRNSSIVFAQLLAVAIGERVGARQATGAVLVAAGAALTALG